MAWNKMAHIVPNTTPPSEATLMVGYASNSKVTRVLNIKPAAQ
ncbi:MAG: hypothetical protein QMC30_09745 [Porticoccaceae bacterium]